VITHASDQRYLLEIAGGAVAARSGSPTRRTVPGAGAVGDERGRRLAHNLMGGIAQSPGAAYAGAVQNP
jgi:hypothetical protein